MLRTKKSKSGLSRIAKVLFGESDGLQCRRKNFDDRVSRNSSPRCIENDAWRNADDPSSSNWKRLVAWTGIAVSNQLVTPIFGVERTYFTISGKAKA